ncbi:MAG: hypothetical protein ACXABY_34150 [Candidatus Thorarchaeota archaeon]|jgi:hypothetical protein
MANLTVKINLDNAAFDDDFALAIREALDSVITDMHYLSAKPV